MPRCAHNAASATPCLRNGQPPRDRSAAAGTPAPRAQVIAPIAVASAPVTVPPTVPATFPVVVQVVVPPPSAGPVQVATPVVARKVVARTVVKTQPVIAPAPAATTKVSG